MDIKATIGQLTAERDKLDKAIQALQALEDSSARHPGRRPPAPRAYSLAGRAGPPPPTARAPTEGTDPGERRQTRHHRRRRRFGDSRTDRRQR